MDYTVRATEKHGSIAEFYTLQEIMHILFH